MKIFGRDPAAWLGFIAAVVQLIAALYPALSPELQGLINAAATAVMGLAIAAVVAREKVIPAASGALVAVLQLAVALGLPVDQEFIGTASVALTAGLVLWLRGQVTAPIGPEGTKVVPGAVLRN